MRAAIRFAAVRLLLALAALHASEAGAVELSILTPTTVTVAPGGSFTIELALDNANEDPTRSLVVDAFGLAGNANATSGVSASSYFNGFCSALGCLGGLNSNDNAFFDHDDLVNGAASGYEPGDDSIAIVRALTINQTTATGAGDPGLTDTPGVHDPTDARLVLQVIGSSDFTLTVRTTFQSIEPLGSTVLPDRLIHVIVPEPGTALLVGLGLAGLAHVQRGRGTPS